MPPAVKIRQFLASKGNAKASGSDAKVSTPLLRLKLQTRTATPTATPVRQCQHQPLTNELSATASQTAEVTEAQAVDGGKINPPQQPGQHQLGAQLHLTLIQVPLLPKPDARRPAAPADAKALLERLHSLRTAGAGLLAATLGDRLPGASPFSAPASTRGTIISTSDFSGPSSPSRWPLRPTAALTAPSAELAFQSPAKTTHLTFGVRSSAAAAATPPCFARSQQPLPLTAHVASTSSLARTPDGRTATAGAGAIEPYLSPPSMVGLRQQELKDTGGGFLTHFANPRDLCTPLPAPAARGGAGAAAGSSTSLSLLRSMHRLQKLHRLQREGGQLVAAMEEALAGAGQAVAVGQAGKAAG